MAVHAAPRGGCRVTTTTISREQHELAEAAGARGRPRGPGHGAAAATTATSTGRYDRLVSVEMIEAVGWQYFDDFFRRCASCCARRADAAAGDHDRRRRLRGREGGPGASPTPTSSPAAACPRSRRSHAAIARETDMRTVWLDDIPPTTRRPCAPGASASSAPGERLEELGYDERFRRTLGASTWRFSEAGFRERADRRRADAVREAALERPPAARSRHGGPPRRRARRRVLIAQ